VSRGFAVDTIGGSVSTTGLVDVAD